MQLESAWSELRTLSLDVLLALLPGVVKTASQPRKIAWKEEIAAALVAADWAAGGCNENGADAVVNACMSLLLPPLAAQSSLSFSIDSSIKPEQHFAVSLLEWCITKAQIGQQRISSRWSDVDIRHAPAIFLLIRSLYGDPLKRSAPAAPFFVFLHKMLREEATFGLASHALLPCLPPERGTARHELCNLALELRQRGDAVHLILLSYQWLTEGDFKLPDWILDAVADSLADSRTFMRKEAASLLQLLYTAPRHLADPAALAAWNADQWSLYSALLATLEEAAAHLLTPLWSRRISLTLSAATERWFIALYRRALQHQHGLVRRLAAEAAFTSLLASDSVDQPALAVLPDLLPDGLLNSLAPFLSRTSAARRSRALQVCASHLTNVPGPPQWMLALATVVASHASAEGAPFLAVISPACARIAAQISPSQELMSVLASCVLSAASSAFSSADTLTPSQTIVISDLGAALDLLYRAGWRKNGNDPLPFSATLLIPYLNHAVTATDQSKCHGLAPLLSLLSPQSQERFFHSLDALAPATRIIVTAKLVTAGATVPPSLLSSVLSSLPARVPTADETEVSAMAQLAPFASGGDKQALVAAATTALHAPNCLPLVAQLWLAAGGSADITMLRTTKNWNVCDYSIAARLLELGVPIIDDPFIQQLCEKAMRVVETSEFMLTEACEFLAAAMQSHKSAVKEPSELIEHVWQAWKDTRRKSMRLTTAFISILFHPVCWNETSLESNSSSSSAPLALRHWAEAVDLATRSPRVAIALVAVVCAAWKCDLPRTTRLHLSCVLDVAQLPQLEQSEKEPGDDDGKSAPLLFGTWLSTLESNDTTKKFACALASAIISALSSPPLSEREYGPASPVNARKVSLWRTLCVLAPLLSNDDHLCTKLWRVLKLKNHPNVRQLMQLFIASLLLLHPPWISQHLLPLLREPNHEYQYAASLAMITADVLAFLPTEETVLSTQLFECLVPLTLHFHHSVRVAAQTVVHHLLGVKPQLRQSNSLLDSIFRYLDGNQDMTKLRAATVRGFSTAASPLQRSQVAQLYAREEVELLEWARRAVRSFQAALGGGQNEAQDDEEEKDKSGGGGGDFQRRRATEPGWAAAVRALEERVEMHNNQRLGARRFPAIVVGSLLDNVPNVAGLARSCEIFGVAQLCIPNKKVLAEAAFQRMSVSAEHHLPVTEVKTKNLPAYLTDMRKQGYTIIAIEQTANSHSLYTFQFPAKSLLVLGTEQEGLPASLLPLMDACVEIPQYGRLRSLNAHVSASLVLAEYAKQQAEKKQ